MEFLKEIFRTTPEYKRLLSVIKDRKLPAAVSGLSHIHKALFFAAFAENGRKALVLTSDEGECSRLSEDLQALGCRPLIFCARDFTMKNIRSYSKEYEQKRIGVLSEILSGDFDVVLAPADAAMQLTLPPEKLKNATFKIAVGDTLSVEELLKKLSASGYTATQMVEGPGQYSCRGGIVDVFPPSQKAPLRLDFFGDELDKLTLIDPETQRSTESLDAVFLTPASEVFPESYLKLAARIEEYKKSTKKLSDQAIVRLDADIDALKNGVSVPFDRYLPLIFQKETSIFDYLKKVVLFVSESLKVTERVRAVQWQYGEDVKALLEDGSLSKGLEKYLLEPSELFSKFQDMGAVYFENFARSSYETKLFYLESVNFQQSSFWGGSVFTLLDDLSTRRKEDTYVILAGGEKAAKVLCRELSEGGVAATFSEDPKKLSKGVTVTSGGLSAGFYLPSIGFTLITQGRASGKKKSHLARPKNSKPYGSLEELCEGDYVVHAAHGIGVFDGIQSMSVQGVKKDYIKIKYAGQDILYVPVTQLDLVSKYIGPREDSGVRLHKLGGTEWSRTRSRVKHAVKDMAKQLTVLYAKRMQTKGYAFGADGDLQSDFESRFEFEETDDQLRCIGEIKKDMERAVPMDRLLCGDVGFGKTEVALRAAFKCVAEGKQCAILVPTTILAWQHYNTAIARVGTMPVNIEMLSRFRTKKQQTEILRKLRSGEIDLLVGTHRLISKDVQFRDIGLVIVDEEQRFGVEQKEKLKELFPQVDVLTLTATPIPRTLNMAMTGLRDMSVIEEAPQDRHPVQTYVLEQDNGILQDAISRELRRGGQVYYLHNRVESIDAAAARIQMQFPDAAVATAHGKMDEETLSRVWGRLLEHEIDILVCTTIIETGVDVPNANTLIIEDADHMGLSQLHQLRGRVGRSTRRAYAYLCFRRGKALSDVAAKRLDAIREYTEFGSGFKIAMRDLEIRGAGSILGGEQHGHMEAVGYDMYLKLLSEAIAEEKGEPQKTVTDECTVDLAVPAHIPKEYIEALPQRLGVYRRIADIHSESDREDVIDELIDRFGDPPKAVLALCDIALLRARAAAVGIREVSQREGNILLYVENIMSKPVANLCSTKKLRALLNAGNKPYVSVKSKPGAPIDTLYEILKIMEEK